MVTYVYHCIVKDKLIDSIKLSYVKTDSNMERGCIMLSNVLSCNKDLMTNTQYDIIVAGNIFFNNINSCICSQGNY